jgi:hypothetical protein
MTGVEPPAGEPPVPGVAPPVGEPPVPDVEPPVGEPPVTDVAPPVAVPPVPGVPAVAGRPPVLIPPPVPRLTLVCEFPPEIPDPPAPTPAPALVWEPLCDEQEAAANKTTPQVRSTLSDFMLFLLAVSPSGSLSDLCKRALTSWPCAMGKGYRDNLRQARLNPSAISDEDTGEMKSAENSACARRQAGTPCLDFRPRLGGSGCAL